MPRAQARTMSHGSGTTRAEDLDVESTTRLLEEPKTAVDTGTSGTGLSPLEVDLKEALPLPPPASSERKAVHLACAAIGLLGSYVTWGYMQELVKRHKYGKTDQFEGEKFPSDLFLVFGNRLLALVVSAVMVLPGVRPEPPGGRVPQAPWYSFVPCSVSNVLSSFAQYHCLNFISFPLQVVSKSCKVIPVMLTGMCVHGKSYDCIEYAEAVGIAAGVSMFSLFQSSGSGEDKDTKAYGLFLIAMYLTCDSFTSQWQDRVFNKHRIDQYQMMFGVTCFSILSTVCALFWNGEFGTSLQFLSTYPEAILHVATLSVTSATGQMFIYYTIKKFGPIVFTIIMTTRQMISLILSSIVYMHNLGPGCWLGAFMVFGTISYRIRRKMRAQSGA